MIRLFASVVSLLLIGIGTHGAPAGLIANGNFESVTGGIFDTWTYTAGRVLVQSDSVISGNYSAEIVGSFYDNLRQQPSEAVSNFIYQMDFAVFPYTSGRTMNTLLYWSSGSIAVNMRVENGNRLQAYDGGAWQNIGTLTANTTADTGTPNIWDGEEPVVNRLSIVGHFGAVTPYYDVTLNGNTVGNVQFFQSTLPADATVFRLQLQGGGGTRNWLADNVLFVPEPSGALMLGTAVFLGLAFRRRRRGLSGWAASVQQNRYRP